MLHCLGLITTPNHVGSTTNERNKDLTPPQASLLLAYPEYLKLGLAEEAAGTSLNLRLLVVIFKIQVIRWIHLSAKDHGGTSNSWVACPHQINMLQLTTNYSQFCRHISTQLAPANTHCEADCQSCPQRQGCHISHLSKTSTVCSSLISWLMHWLSKVISHHFNITSVLINIFSNPFGAAVTNLRLPCAQSTTMESRRWWWEIWNQIGRGGSRKRHPCLWPEKVEGSIYAKPQWVLMYHVICHVTNFILHWDTTYTIYYCGHWLRVPQFSPS